MYHNVSRNIVWFSFSDRRPTLPQNRQQLQNKQFLVNTQRHTSAEQWDGTFPIVYHTWGCPVLCIAAFPLWFVFELRLCMIRCDCFTFCFIYIFLGCCVILSCEQNFKMNCFVSWLKLSLAFYFIFKFACKNTTVSQFHRNPAFWLVQELFKDVSYYIILCLKWMFGAMCLRFACLWCGCTAHIYDCKGQVVCVYKRKRMECSMSYHQEFLWIQQKELSNMCQIVSNRALFSKHLRQTRRNLAVYVKCFFEGKRLGLIKTTDKPSDKTIFLIPTWTVQR